MSSEETGFFQGENGIRLFYRYFGCPGSPEMLVLLHGHGEHSGRYQKFADILAEQKISIAVYDARGYGRSEGREVYVETFEEFSADLTLFVKFLQSSYSAGKKISLFGHSLGGLVAVHWALRNPEKIKALFLSSPFLGLKLPKPLIWLNSFLNSLNPGFLYQNPIYPPHLTHNPEEIQNYKKDLLIKRKITARLLSEVLLYQAELEGVSEFPFPFPVYILAAGLEKVVNLASTSAFFQKIQSPHKEMKIFDGFYHEIFNEIEQEKAFTYLNACLSASR